MFQVDRRGYGGTFFYKKKGENWIDEPIKNFQIPMHTRINTRVQCVYLGRQTGVRVVQSSRNLVLPGDGFHLLNKSDDGLVLLIGFSKRGFELFMSVQKALNLLHGVNNEHVHQILTGAIQPIVERLSPEEAEEKFKSLI